MAFAMATVVAQSHPNLPVRILSFGIASTIGLARVADEGHWSSDVFLGAAMGTALGYSVVYHDRERQTGKQPAGSLTMGPRGLQLQHAFLIGPLWFVDGPIPQESIPIWVSSLSMRCMPAASSVPMLSYRAFSYCVFLVTR